MALSPDKILFEQHLSVKRAYFPDKRVTSNTLSVKIGVFTDKIHLGRHSSIKRANSLFLAEGDEDYAVGAADAVEGGGGGVF